MAEPNVNEIKVLSEPWQTVKPTTAEIAEGSSKPTIDTTRMPTPQVQEPTGGKTGPVPLLPANDIVDLHTRWTDVQAGFVDAPRESVEKADALVADVMKRLAETFTTERSKLEAQWSRGDNVSTEDLRMALRHYRSFFDRLLSL